MNICGICIFVLLVVYLVKLISREMNCIFSDYMFTPIVVIVIGTYFIASSFFNVYAMAVDTLFLCFLEDLERNDGTPSRPYFMSVGLQKVVGTMQKFNENQPLAPIQQQQQRK